MKKILIIALLLVSVAGFGQQFINSGLIEYEVRRNNHKLFGDGIWADMARERFPQFSTNYYHLLFANNQGLYRYDHKDERTKMPWGNEGEDNLWFNDYAHHNYTHQKFVFDNTYLLSDSLMHIDWKLSPNETREIAGFLCRKATGIIFDSVYIFAFYTDEITVSGGPMGISGLPGMILGITVPRMYTSWVATRVQLSGFDPKQIKAPTKGKKKVGSELQETVRKAVADWGTWGKQQLWNIFL